MSHTALAVVPDGATNETAHQTGGDTAHRARNERGATTAEYATVTGCGVGFAAVLFKLLTSDIGQALLKGILNAIKSLLPF